MAIAYFEEDGLVSDQSDERFQGVVQRFRQAASEYRESFDPLGEIRALNGLWRCYRLANRLGEADSIPLEASRIADTSEDVFVRLEARLLETRHAFEVQASLGGVVDRLHAAYQDAESAVDSETDAGKLRLLRRTLQILGHATRSLGRFEDAVRTYQEQVRVSREVENRGDEARALYNLAVTQAYLLDRGHGDFEEVINNLQAVLDLFGSVPNDSVVYSHLELGRLLSGSQAESHLTRCVELSRSLSRTSQSSCLAGLAEFELKENGPKARNLLFQALSVLGEDPKPFDVLVLWPLYQQVSWLSFPGTKAKAVNFALLDAIEASWAAQKANPVGGDYDSAVALGDWSRAYFGFAGNLLRRALEEQDPGAAAQALAVAERMRGRILLDALNLSEVAVAREAGVPEVPEPDTPLRKAEELRRTLLSAFGPEGEGMRDVRNVTGDESEETLLGQRSDLASLAQVQAALSADQAILSYQWIDDPDVYGVSTGGSWVMGIHRDGVEVIPLEPASKTRNQLRIFRSKVSKGQSDPKLAAWLHEQLLSEVLDALPEAVKHLILIPDGELHGLPFSALAVAEDQPPLGTRYRLSTVPSATLWLRWSRRSVAPPPPVVLAFADPEREPGDPVEEQIGKSLVPLPRARREGRRLVDRLGAGSVLSTGKEATEEFLATQDLSAFGLLHFATHTVVDHEAPHRSAVILADGEGEDDGLVHPAEIAALELTDRLVVLSACGTASGEILRGEGVMGLGRAFFAAGARTVVGTLWPVADADAERFIDGFYARIAAGDNVSEASRRTREELWRAGASPQSWSAFVVLGDGELVPVPEGASLAGLGPLSPKLRWGGLLGLGLLAVFLLLRRWRR